MAAMDRSKPVFMWTQGLRLLLWEIMEKFMELRAAAKELHFLDPSFPMHESEAQTREGAYLKILSCFPPGRMTLSEIARQYSQLKDKITNQKKADKQHEDFMEKQRPTAPSSASVHSQSSELNSSTPSAAPIYRPLSPAMSPNAIPSFSQDRESRAPRSADEAFKSEDNGALDDSSNGPRRHSESNPQTLSDASELSSGASLIDQQRRNSVSNHPSTLERPPSTTLKDRQYLHRSMRSPLPPSPNSPQNAWNASGNNKSVATIVGRRPREGSGSDATASRLPKSHLQQSITTPGYEPSAVQSNPNPRPIPAPIQQAIYDSLLRAQGGPAKKIRMSYRAQAEDEAARAQRSYEEHTKSFPMQPQPLTQRGSTSQPRGIYQDRLPSQQHSIYQSSADQPVSERPPVAGKRESLDWEWKNGDRRREASSVATKKWRSSQNQSIKVEKMEGEKMEGEDIGGRWQLEEQQRRVAVQKERLQEEQRKLELLVQVKQEQEQQQQEPTYERQQEYQDVQHEESYPRAPIQLPERRTEKTRPLVQHHDPIHPRSYPQQCHPSPDAHPHHGPHHSRLQSEDQCDSWDKAWRPQHSATEASMTGSPTDDASSRAYMQAQPSLRRLAPMPGSPTPYSDPTYLTPAYMEWCERVNSRGTRTEVEPSKPPISFKHWEAPRSRPR
ncbi:hypothetical protein BC939DRAFT_446933 [Gamsiella multidivaricata]|uniref:uncharacterized protein n=1 Tax=Gamsiella multidivaricata TaxID=101098 RepID=UPI00221FD661|nr:uncharacterized protein BC939DRAFT_446933 [Gamsiella multidivaricata]KAI7826619.1 hypothetical protein BC939DRAFT_446933 [Gamsiella multidivaricata]